MSWRRGKSSGWAAYDLKQQQKRSTELESQNEPYPPISSNIAYLHPCKNTVKNDDLSSRSFSSVLIHSENLRTLPGSKDIGSSLQIGNSSTNQSQTGTDKKIDVIESYKKLKELHDWADRNLIEDIMESVNNDFDKVSALLKEMVAPNVLEERREAQFEDVDCNLEDCYLHTKLLREDIDPCLGKTTDLSESSNNSLSLKNKELADDHCGKVIPYSNEDLKLILDSLKFIPVEPEWEEDDIYILHRKDAIRMMRFASRHSKAANDAYLRGDHLSAQEFSIRAREEWDTADKLNANAAKDILNIRNVDNNEWKLDLHGLHSAEAVQALQEHLNKIECKALLNRSAHPNIDDTKTVIRRVASLDSSTCMETKGTGKQQKLSRQRARLLEVVTGRGNHSRGQAALPTAIRSFLSEKGYHYDEPRSGVITVRPKFRQL